MLLVMVWDSKHMNAGPTAMECPSPFLQEEEVSSRLGR